MLGRNINLAGYFQYNEVEPSISKSVSDLAVGIHYPIEFIYVAVCTMQRRIYDSNQATI